MQKFRWVATSIALMTLAAGCSSGADGKAGADETAVGEQAIGELRVGITAPIAVDPATLDPARAIDVLVADLIYDGLTTVDPSSGEVRPGLAKSWTSGDGMAWTFSIDPARTYSDGSAVTAAEVVDSLNRVAGLHGTSLAGARLDIVQGYPEVESGASKTLSGLSAPDESTVAITLTAPNYELPALLADPAYGIVKDQGATVPILSSQLVGTGPMRARSGGPDGATLIPAEGVDLNVDGIQFVKFDDTAAAKTALGVGDIDIAPIADGVRAPDGAHSVLVTGATLVLETNAASGIFSNPAARAALRDTIDRVAAARAATRDESRVATSLVPGSLTDGCGAGCPTPSPTAADGLRLVGTGAALHLDAPAGARASAVATAIAEQLTAAGLATAVRASDGAGLTATLGAGRQELVLFGVMGTAPTADPYLAAALGSSGRENLSGYSNSFFDVALASARGTADSTARAAAYRQLEQVALAETPVIPLVTLGERFAIADRVTGVTPWAGRLFDGTKVGLGG